MKLNVTRGNSFRNLKRILTSEVVRKKIVPELEKIHTHPGLTRYRMALHDMYDLEPDQKNEYDQVIKKGTSDYALGFLQECFDHRETELGIQDELPTWD